MHAGGSELPLEKFLLQKREEALKRLPPELVSQIVELMQLSIVYNMIKYNII